MRGRLNPMYRLVEPYKDIAFRLDVMTALFYSHQQSTEVRRGGKSGEIAASNSCRPISTESIIRSTIKSHKWDNLSGSLLEHLGDGTLEPVTELFQCVERDVL